MKMRKSIKLSCFLIAVLVSLLSLTGCFPSLEDYEPTDTALELVGEAAFTSIYNEETGYYDVYVEGVATNVGELELNNCYVSFAVYDSVGNLICVAEDYITFIGVGDSWRFAAIGATRYEPATVELIELSGYDW